jgi:hypothetical protein
MSFFAPARLCERVLSLPVSSSQGPPAAKTTKHRLPPRREGGKEKPFYSHAPVAVPQATFGIRLFCIPPSLLTLRGFIRVHLCAIAVFGLRVGSIVVHPGISSRQGKIGSLFWVGQVGNLRNDCQSVQPGDSPPWQPTAPSLAQAIFHEIRSSERPHQARFLALICRRLNGGNRVSAMLAGWNPAVEWNPAFAVFSCPSVTRKAMPTACYAAADR